jgi:outer membrane protein OmpA-like peptidoglycan-associated protein/tetratricopeptide (TPR) repeat protein
MNTILKRIFLFGLIVLCANMVYSQEGKVKKATKKFDRYSYIDAREIYLKVVEEGYQSAQIYKKLGDTYYYNSDYNNAAKWYKKLVEEFPDDLEPIDYYRAAQSLKSLKQYEESDELMKAYSSLDGSNILIQKFNENPDYLNSISNIQKDYTLKKSSVNSSSSDFGPAFFNDKVVYATASSTMGDKIYDWNQQAFLDLYVADMDTQGNLSNAKPLPGEVNTEMHEASAVFTKDGRTMYFTRNNYIDGKKGKDKDKYVRLKIYRASRTGDTFWTDIVELPFNDDSYSVAYPALSNDEKRLYFSSDMPGTLGMSDLWYVDILENDEYGTPVNLGSSINTEAREAFPFISDKNNFYFSSDGHLGLGGLDVFVAALDKDGKPGEISNLGEPVNGSQDDFGFIINEEKRIGFFTSSREGDGGSINDDIYGVIERCEISITGIVTDKDTGDLIPGATVSMIDNDNNLIASTVVGIDATFSFSADCDSKYSIKKKKNEYNPDEKVVETPNVTGTIHVPLQLKSIGCPPNDLGCRLTLLPIYFDFDRYNIRPDAEIELAKILAAMKEYPQLIIHIESHTDSRGSDTYNELLSEKRAQSTLNWLVEKGIDSNRLSAKGYGEYKLVNECSNGVDCTEEEHQLNRRSMFIIQN